jgi:hypothetical protein
MVVIARMFDNFAKTIRDVTKIVEQGGDIWNNLTYAFHTKLTDALKDLTAIIKSLDWEGMGRSFGGNITKILTDPKLGTALNDALTAGLQGIADMVIGSIKAAIKQLTSDLDVGAAAKREIKGTAQVFGGLATSPVLNAIPSAITDPIGTGGNLIRGAWDSIMGTKELPGASKLSPQSNINNKTNRASAVININGATGDNQQLASMVMDKINGMWQDRTNASLA